MVFLEYVAEHYGILGALVACSTGLVALAMHKGVHVKFELSIGGETTEKDAVGLPVVSGEVGRAA